MNILIVSQHFWPESFRINEVAKSLARQGNRVDVLTGKPNYPDGVIYSGYVASGCTVEQWNEISVFRVPLFPRGKKSKIGLGLNYLSFIFSCLVLGTLSLRHVRPDVIFVYATSPLLQALPALFLGWIKRCPVVVNVQDLWPESLEATGYINSRWFIRLVEIAVQYIYRHADLVLVSSRPFEDSIRRFKPKGKVRYFPNSVESDFCNPDSGVKVDLMCLDGGFSVVFAGNIGSAQAVHVIVEAANFLKSKPMIRLILLGSGSELEWLEEQRKIHQLDNLYLPGRFPVEAMPCLLSKASVLLVTLADRPIFHATVPNKIQAYMAVGRPIIVCANGEGARLVSEAECGVSVPAEDGRRLADAIELLSQLPQNELDKMGRRGRTYYETNFDHERLMRDLNRYFTELTVAT